MFSSHLSPTTPTFDNSIAWSNSIPAQLIDAFSAIEVNLRRSRFVPITDVNSNSILWPLLDLISRYCFITNNHSGTWHAIKWEEFSLVDLIANKTLFIVTVASFVRELRGRMVFRGSALGRGRENILRNGWKLTQSWNGVFSSSSWIIKPTTVVSMVKARVHFVLSSKDWQKTLFLL